MTEYPDNYKDLRRRIYAMRNGIVADSLRRGGCPHRLVFGVTLPQLVEIARETPGNPIEIARLLKADTDLREARLLAMIMYPAEALSADEAYEWACQSRWTEDADILCFKLLRDTPYARDLAAKLCADDDAILRYTGLRLYLNIVSKCPQEALRAAEDELLRPKPLSQLASMLAEEARFLLEDA